MFHLKVPNDVATKLTSSYPALIAVAERQLVLPGEKGRQTVTSVPLEEVLNMMIFAKRLTMSLIQMVNSFLKIDLEFSSKA